MHYLEGILLICSPEKFFLLNFQKKKKKKENVAARH